MAPSLEVQELSEQQFTELRGEWQDCLAASGADPVFASWPWCHSWWRTWSVPHSLELLLLVVREHQDILGIAPLYMHKVKRKLGPSGYQLQFIGNIWRKSTVRSEHTDFIIRNGYRTEVMGAIAAYLATKDWDDLLICDHPPGLLEEISGWGKKVTLRGHDRGVSVDVRGDFGDWLGSVGKNTRLKLFNRRTYLGDRLQLERIPPNNSTEREFFFRLLCRLHQDRRQAQPERAEIDFHQRLAESSGKYLLPVYSVMKVDGAEVSAIYDIIAGGRRYNLHSVFAGDIDKKVSLGTLHLGFALEESFQDPQVQQYDFLAGEGKNSFYKERLKGNTGREYTLMTSQISANLHHQFYMEVQMLARKFRNRLAATLRRDKPCP